MQDSYRELFLSESLEYLNVINNCLVKLEDNPADLESLNEIFRCIHTLKGMSATMGFEKLTQVAHQAENLLDELRSQKRKVTTEIIDILFAAVDILERLTEEVKLRQESKIDIAPCIENLRNILTVKSESVETFPTAKGAEKTQAPQPEPVFEFNEEELKRLKQIKDNGYGIYKVKVTLNKECTLKEARVFLVMNNLQKMGEIERSVPPLEDLRKGKVEQFFTVIFVTKELTEKIHADLLAVSEIESVVVSEVDMMAKAASAAQPLAGHAKKISSMRIPVERLDKIMNLMGELAIAKIRLMQISQARNIDALEGVSVVLDRLISSLQDEVMQTRLLPASYILDTFPRMVRDLARKQGKEVELEIIGGEIELDRVALDEKSDPLVHLIRNAIDHGIESPQERKALKKNPCSKLLIQVSRQKGQIFIEIVDDGRGVDFEAVKRVALGKGLITEEEAVSLDEKKILDLITMPGFSTAKKVTDISGRGVGLDVVKSKIESLGGRLEFETKLKEGSRFILTLPLTLAIIKAMLVRVGEEIFAVPLMSVREIIKIKENELKFIQRFEVARIREEIIPIIRLERELDIICKPEAGSEGILSVIIIEYGKKALGLVVSQVLGEQDIVVKPLGSIVKRTKGVAGATILGDGKVALILDTMSLK
ncbi:MAG: chemotaxis protein CheA [Candidatus Omnitrophica bacterium]|nr:chemotaxis protein CheA [Candidatus Omnitrophota bacterium]